jgi:hypothetical protein
MFRARAAAKWFEARGLPDLLERAQPNLSIFPTIPCNSGCDRRSPRKFNVYAQEIQSYR